MSFDYRTQATSRGYALDEVVSALQKAIRRSDPAEATWWAAELDRSGHQSRLWNRLWVIVSEDIGPAWPEGPATLYALHHRWENGRKQDRRLFVMHAVLALALAEKSRWVDEALAVNYSWPERLYEIPDHAIDGHTTRGRAMGRGSEFFAEHSAVLVNEANLGPNPFAERADAAIGPEFDRAYRLQWSQGRKRDERGTLWEDES